MTLPFGRRVNDEILEQLFVEDVGGWTQVRMPVLEWSDSLRERGIRTAILSNMPIDHMSYILEHLPWMRRFEVRVFSADVRMTKPDPAIFRLCVERIGVKADECLFIDDLPVNVEAARREGLQGFAFESERDLSKLRGLHPELA